MYEYIITITGDYDILVLSPQMVAQLIEKVKNSDTKKMVIPAEEIIPQGYAEYLLHVLEANPQICQSNNCADNVYELITNQIEKLKVNQHQCFDKVNFSNRKKTVKFMLSTNENFYVLVKQEKSSFLYSYKDLDGENSKVTLIYQRSSNDI